MKNYFFLQLLIVIGFVNTLKSMDDEQKPQKLFSLCRQILTIDPNALAADYKALAQRLHDAKLSTCECATYLTHEKKQKALRALKKEGFLSDRSIKGINEFQDEIKKSNESLNELVVEIPKDLPEDIKGEIIDHFSPRFSPIKFKINEFRLQTGAATFYYFAPKFGDFKFRGFKKELSSIEPKYSFLRIKPGIQNDSPFNRKFTYLHEEQHIKYRHSLIDDVISRKLFKELRKKGKGNESFPYKTMEKLSRAYETEADLLPTACGTCDDAYTAIASFRDRPHDNRKHDGKHPSHRTRYKRAQRIYNLKLAEEALKQKEEPQVL